MPPSWTRPGIKHKRRLGVGKYTNAGWVDFRVPRGYARSIFMKMESSPLPRVCQYHASVRVQWKLGRGLFHRRVDNRVRFARRSIWNWYFSCSLSLYLSIYLSSFFSSFFLSPRFSSSYLEINERKREREKMGRRILKIGEHTRFGYSNWKDKNFIRRIIEGIEWYINK